MKVFKNSKPKIFLTIGVLVWAALIVFLLFNLVTERMQVFDEEQSVLSNYATVESYLDEIEKVFSIAASDGIQVIRVTEPNCDCNFASSLHWTQLQNQYSEVEFFEVNVQALDEASLALVPSTPMAIVSDSSGQVLYAGPFSDANYCNADNSLIEAYLNESLNQRYSPLETQGCYCKTQPNRL
ncbi:DUF6436 domain-containing protein [Reinekea sp.]|jgi:hypothetical protein|uniref:DUF6436 domain-containing protein n=1 Tax=Reinekea sp. TaxID=1970455 RepID=UPI003989C681